MIRTPRACVALQDRVSFTMQPWQNTSQRLDRIEHSFLLSPQEKRAREL